VVVVSVVFQPRAATITATRRLICQKLDRATFKRLMGPLEDVLRSNMEVCGRVSVPQPAPALVVTRDCGAPAQLYRRYEDAIPRVPITEAEEKEADSDDDDSSSGDEEGKR
jgi:hypothetical protein